MPTNHDREIRVLHESLSLLALRAEALFGLVVAVPLLLLRSAELNLAPVPALLLTVISVVAAWRPPAHRWRVMLAVGLLLIGGFAGLWRFGLYGDARGMLILACLLAMVFHRRLGYATTALVLVAYVAYLVEIRHGLFSVSQSVTVMVGMALPSMAISFAGTLLFGVLVTHYLAYLIEQGIVDRTLANDRLHELNASLEQKVEARTQEVVAARDLAQRRLEEVPAALFVSDWSGVHGELEALRAAGHEDPGRVLRDDPGLASRLLGLRRTVWCNEGLLHLYGFDAIEEWRSHYRQHPPSDHELFHAAELLDTGRCHYRSRETCRDGSTVFIDWSVVVPDGDWSRLTGVGEDVTTEALLAEQVQAGLQELAEGVTLMDADLCLYLCNRRFYELLDLPAEQLPVGTHLADFLRYNARRGEYGPGDIEAQVAERLELARQRVNHQFVRQRGDRILRVTGRALPDGGFVTVYTDITALELARRAAIAADTSKRELFDSIDDGVLRFEADRVVLDNPQARALLGVHELETLEGRSLVEICGEITPGLFPGRSLELILYRLLAYATAHGRSTEQVWRADDRCIEFQWAIDESVGQILLISDVTDVVKEKLAVDRQLGEAHSRFEQLLESTQVILIGLDGGNRVIESNAAAEGLRTAPGVAGAPLADYLGRLEEASREQLEQAIIELRAGRAVPPVELVFAVPGGLELVVLFTLSISAGSAAGSQGVLLVGTDITALRAAERRLIHAAKLASLGEMATALAHEVNQPLNVIKLAAGNLSRRLQQADGAVEPGEVLPKLERIVAQVTRAHRITDHLRRFGRAPDSAREAIDAAAITRDAVDLMADQLRLDDIEVRLDCDADCEALGNAGGLEQVVTNLLSNARDQLRDGGSAERWIEVAVETVGDRARIRVEDSGGGVPEAMMPRLFDAYFTTKPAGVGTGLGLWLGREMIAGMGGTLEVENGPAGARFTITLPRVADVGSPPAGTH